MQAGVQGWVESIIVMVTDCNADVPEVRMEAVDHVVEKGLRQWVIWSPLCISHLLFPSKLPFTIIKSIAQQCSWHQQEI